jgi:AhpC/TSA family protein
MGFAGDRAMNAKRRWVGLASSLCWAVVTIGVTMPLARAQDVTSQGVKLPTHAAYWVNSAPITNEMLSGKAALLFFFNAQSMGVSDDWRRLLATAEKFQGEPVIFVAVNSGTPRAQLESYLRKNQVPWPTICDSDKSFEGQFEFEISPQSPRQLRVLMPDGSLVTAQMDNIEGAVTDALRNARWKIDPTEIPSQLRSAWEAIEFGKYPDAALGLKKHLNSKGALKEAAQKLNQFVMDDLTAQVDVAEKLLTNEKKWEAYKRFSLIPTKFKGFAVPADIATKIKDLSADDAVKEELAAAKVLDLAKQSASKSASGRKGAIKLLQNLVKDHPNTEAAQEAEHLLKEATQ